MSTQYNIEPPPKGQCVLHTTSGDILLELFAQQAPLAARNFLQLILDGYYTNTIFHRLVPDFIIQGGDPTGTGAGGESSYPEGSPFADEFHPRLKFNRRGLLGMANSGVRNDNASQFFLTLNKCDELTGKHTMFGRVVGNTIFNLVKMGEAELVEGEGSDRPLYPTTITGAEIIENPFEGMEERNHVAQTTTENGNRPKKRQKTKSSKCILSFLDEDGEDGEVFPVKSRAKSNSALIAKTREATEPPLITSGISDLQFELQRQASGSSTFSPSLTTPPDTASPAVIPQSAAKPTSSTLPPRESPSLSSVAGVNNLLKQTNAQIADLKSSLKRHNVSVNPQSSHKKSALEAMIPTTATRGRKRGVGLIPIGHERNAIEAFNAFKQKLESLEAENSKLKRNSGNQDSNRVSATGLIPKFGNASEEKAVTAEDDEEAALCDLHFIINCQSCNNWAQQERSGGSLEDDDDDDETGWMSHSLSFAKDRLGKNLEWKRKNEEELVVIDPREKAKDLHVENIKHRERGKKSTRN